MTQRKHTHNSDSHADLDEDTDAIEPEALEPTDEEVTEEHEAADHQPSKEPQEAPLSTSLVPVTTLQQYLTEIRRYPYLSKEEELRLFEEYQLRGNRDAAMKLILANLRVSVSIASEYLHTGADHMDLIQEGNVGLLQAIKKFDPTKNVRFYAYAAWWARAYILRYLLNTYRLIKVGTTQDQRKLFYNLKKEKAKLEKNMGGIKEMKELPGVIFVIDTRKEAIAVAEARRLDTEHQRLQVEKRAQATPLRVEKLARAQLNMRTATPAITQYVSDPAGAAAAASPNRQTGAEGAR